MPEDAYRPPTSSVTHAAGARPDAGEPGNLDVGRAISEGWQAMLDNFPLWLGVGVVATLLMRSPRSP
jgi:hypothetical protein